MLGLSSFEELDDLIDAGDIGDSPAISPQYEELIKFVSCAVSKLNIDWPAKKWEAQRKSKPRARCIWQKVRLRAKAQCY